MPGLVLAIVGIRALMKERALAAQHLGRELPSWRTSLGQHRSSTASLAIIRLVDVVPVRLAVLSRDTSREAEDLQVQIWRSMTPAQKLDLVLSASEAAREMARAGLRDRHPGASEDEITQRLALVTLGEDLARRVYPDIGRFVE